MLRSTFFFFTIWIPSFLCSAQFGRLEQINYKTADTYVIVPDDMSENEPSTCATSSRKSVFSSNQGPLFVANVTIRPFCGEGGIVVVPQDGRTTCNAFVIGDHVHLENFDFQCSWRRGPRNEKSAALRLTGVGRVYNVTLLNIGVGSERKRSVVDLKFPLPILVHVSSLLPDDMLHLRSVSVDSILGGSVVFKRVSGSAAAYGSTLVERTNCIDGHPRILLNSTELLDWDAWGAEAARSGGHRNDGGTCTLEFAAGVAGTFAAITIVYATCEGARMHTNNRKAAEDAIHRKKDKAIASMMTTTAAEEVEDGEESYDDEDRRRSRSDHFSRR